MKEFPNRKLSSSGSQIPDRLDTPRWRTGKLNSGSPPPARQKSNISSRLKTPTACVVSLKPQSTWAGDKKVIQHFDTLYYNQWKVISTRQGENNSKEKRSSPSLPLKWEQDRGCPGIRQHLLFATSKRCVGVVVVGGKWGWIGNIFQQQIKRSTQNALVAGGFSWLQARGCLSVWVFNTLNTQGPPTLWRAEGGSQGPSPM